MALNMSSIHFASPLSNESSLAIPATPMIAASIWPPPPGDRAPAIYGASILFMVLTLGFLVIRAIHKYQLPFARLAVDDILLVIAILLFLGQIGLILGAVSYGYGEHISLIVHTHPQDLKMALKLPLFAQAVGSFALCFAKLSVGATLLHLCRGVTYLDRRLALTYKVLIVCAIIMAVLGNVVTVAFILTGCSPGESRTSFCRTPPTLAAYLQLTTNLLVNILLVFSTMWLLRKLKLASRDRLAIDLLLCFMFSASITSIVKAVMVPEALVDVQTDLTWEVPVISILLSAEIALSIMAACLPSIRWVLGRHFPSHWRFWRRGDDDGLDLVIDAGTNVHGSSREAPPLRNMRQASISIAHGDIAPVARVRPAVDWSQIETLEEGIKPLGESSVDEVSSHDEKNKDMSLEHPSERDSERNPSPRSSTRLSWS